MKIDMPDEYLPLIVKALERYHVYTRASQRENSHYQEAADFFKRKQPGREESVPKPKRKRA